MAQAATKSPARTGEKRAEPSSAARASWPVERLRRDIDRLFDEFGRGTFGFPTRRSMFEMEPFGRAAWRWTAEPAVDITETDKAYEVTAELPGMDENGIEVKVANGGLTIRGEKQDEKQEKTKDYYLHERHFGSFGRCFRLPDGVDADKIEASFKNGVLTITLPKKGEAQEPEKQIEVEAAN